MSFWCLFALWNLIPMYASGVFDLVRGFYMSSKSFLFRIFQIEYYAEGWYSLLNRMAGLLFPGLSAHMPINYTYAVRYEKYV